MHDANQRFVARMHTCVEMRKCIEWFTGSAVKQDAKYWANCAARMLAQIEEAQ
jgi:hypothetical protein